MNIRYALFAFGSLVIAYMPLIAKAEMIGMEEKELSGVSGQSGISIEIPRLRVKAEMVDYVTREHGGGGESHSFAEEFSLNVDMTGAITLDIESDGALVIGLPDSMNFVGDGYSQKGIYINETGTINGGGLMLNEISIQGNFDTGGTITIWSE